MSERQVPTRGDWHCGRCAALNFARRRHCVACWAPRATGRIVEGPQSIILLTPGIEGRDYTPFVTEDRRKITTKIGVWRGIAKDAGAHPDPSPEAWAGRNWLKWVAAVHDHVHPPGPRWGRPRPRPPPSFDPDRYSDRLLAIFLTGSCPPRWRGTVVMTPEWELGSWRSAIALLRPGQPSDWIC